MAIVLASVNASGAADRLEYNRDIRPILSENCFQCHGPDARQRKGKLRLDNRRDAAAPAASGNPAIVPGDLDESDPRSVARWVRKMSREMGEPLDGGMQNELERMESGEMPDGDDALDVARTH